MSASKKLDTLQTLLLGANVIVAGNEVAKQYSREPGNLRVVEWWLFVILMLIALMVATVKARDARMQTGFKVVFVLLAFNSMCVSYRLEEGAWSSFLLLPAMLSLAFSIRVAGDRGERATGDDATTVSSRPADR